jgi:hypothetical protein
MRTAQALTLAILASATFVSGAAMAGEAVHLTPPLFREHARETQKVRSVSDLTTTPQPTVAAKSVIMPRTLQVIAEAAPSATR